MGKNNFINRFMQRLNFMKFIMTMLLMASSFHQGLAQRIDLSKSRLDAINVYMSVEKFGKKTIVKVAKDSTVKEVDEPTFVKLHGINFQDGTIEVNVLNKLLPNASESTADSLVLLFTSTMIIPNLNVSISVPPMAGLKIR